MARLSENRVDDVVRRQVVLTIPTKRKPPVLSLESYAIPDGLSCLIIADPSVLEEHVTYYKDQQSIRVVLGEVGMAAQCAMCYIWADYFNFPYYFRIDDDLAPKTFVHKEGYYPNLAEVITEAESCAHECKVSMVGFANTSNRFWLNEGFGRTWGLVHGGGFLCMSSPDPSEFIDTTLVRGTDVYMTCAHRKRDGAVGRVRFIGFDKKSSTVTAGQTSINVTQEQIDASRDKILEKFPGMVTCNGTRKINGGKHTIANWRMKR